MSEKARLVCELQTRREALGWSLDELGEQCGLDHRRLAEWENGLAEPCVRDLENWAAALHLTLTLVAGDPGSGNRVRVDWTARRITVDGAPVRLTPMEWKALERLAWVPGELVTHQDLFRHLYGTDSHYRAQSTAVRVLITKLRRLLPLRIEAQWRRGYVVKGLESSRPKPTGGSDAAEPQKDRIETEKRPCEQPSRAAPAAPVRPAAMRPVQRLNFVSPSIRQVLAPEPQPGLGRAEELGVIERFLAERGATRCPDVATIQKQPLPTLVWDKVKRKWVRPSLETMRAS